MIFKNNKKVPFYPPQLLKYVNADKIILSFPVSLLNKEGFTGK